MSQDKEHNRRIVLAKRPHGAPVSDNFRLESTPVPEPAEGQVLLRTEYLSLDPYMRGRMNDAPSYAAPVKIDDVMVGATVCQVEASRHPGFKVRTSLSRIRKKGKSMSIIPKRCPGRMTAHF